MIGMITIDLKAENHEKEMIQDQNLMDIDIKPEVEKINFRDIKDFPALYFLCNLSMILMYGDYVVFSNNTQTVLDRKFGVTKGPISGFIYTIPLYVGLPLLPILGKITDKIGRRGEANVLSGIIGKALLNI